VLLGLDDSGKTALMDALAVSHQQMAYDLVPTMGQQFTSYDADGITLQLFDICGLRNFRPSWPAFCEDTHVLVFVIDLASSYGCERAMEALQALNDILRITNTQFVRPVIVFSKLDVSHSHPLPCHKEELAARLTHVIPSESSVVFCSAKAFFVAHEDISADVLSQMTFDSRAAEVASAAATTSTATATSTSEPNETVNMEEQDESCIRVHIGGVGSEDISVNILPEVVPPSQESQSSFDILSFVAATLDTHCACLNTPADGKASMGGIPVLERALQNVIRMSG
jgi:GTPase SAR1 family protein